MPYLGFLMKSQNISIVLWKSNYSSISITSLSRIWKDSSLIFFVITQKNSMSKQQYITDVILIHLIIVYNIRVMRRIFNIFGFIYFVII